MAVTQERDATARRIHQHMVDAHGHGSDEGYWFGPGDDNLKVVEGFHLWLHRTNDPSVPLKHIFQPWEEDA